ncbi:CHAT domain-containing protein [Vitiosangium sp. GDMCC 1.1324]|uniref:CHAT domain-containing protein n=1 Tax=Vitiosangium sp. (strain GDMCC 1.1324) TaxID=2138576 RepID=UPI000D3B00D0|nr:CHAT domain-containing protein [Vitiosangium sp. GDMCC 1.1324]PTL83439.1 hypothetical protein DAT35_15825 [Vitiosangium sp. GDMCC 1.1324]
MSSRCEDLELFADGEMADADADSFRVHLASCARCQNRLLELMHLEVMGQEVSARKRSRRWVVPLALAASLLAVFIGALVASREHSRTPEPLTVALLRPMEARLTYSGASAYRGYGVARAGEGSSGEQVPEDVLARLIQDKDFHGVATAYLLMGAPKLAGDALTKTASSPDVDCDRAVVALAQGAHSEALRLLEGVLSVRPAHPQALWNRALVLRDLGLPLAAAETFSRVAALGESGWAREAEERARALRQEAEASRTAWLGLDARSLEMVKGGAPLPEEDARRNPGFSRLRLYDAARSATSPEEVRGLLPLAQALDREYRTDVLERYLRSLVQADFRRRSAAAREYRQLVLGSPPSDTEALLSRLRSSGEGDIELGTMVLSRSTSRRPERFSELVARAADPWFDILALHERARELLLRDESAEAESVLLSALARCERERLDYRCARLELELAGLYNTVHRIEAALLQARRGLERVRRTHEWELEQIFLQRLAQIARFQDDFPLARAYLEEVLLESEGGRDACAISNYVHETLANMALIRVDRETGLRELKLAPTCGAPPSAFRAAILADLVRLGAPPDVEHEFWSALATLRAAEDSGEGTRIFLDYLEGRVVIERDSARGQRLLRDAIDRAERQPVDNIQARKARASSLAVLAIDALRTGVPQQALEAISRAMELPTPERCALGFAMDDERLVMVARDGQGRTRGELQVQVTTGPLEPEKLVPESLRTHLAGCPRVEVLAPAPLQGRPSLLPPEVAWSYRLKSGAPPGAPGLPERRLVVHDIQAPESLNLAPLGPWSPEPRSPDLVEVRGTEATPSRVQELMGEATVIEFHVHGLVDQAEASALVLSPDRDGRFALKAREVRERPLKGAPLVILGACDAARTLPWKHEAWSLPAAFLEAGARGVLASTSRVQDADASVFFDAVRARIRAGSTPAAALRDERLVWLSREPRSWVRDVMLFE